jgi:hypothetical protein
VLVIFNRFSSRSCDGASLEVGQIFNRDLKIYKKKRVLHAARARIDDPRAALRGLAAPPCIINPNPRVPPATWAALTITSVLPSIKAL